ncbi:hypothetical protein [Evansella tamaricis]|uniref:Uncharacterized protein n=1 Tax=Evansella tamaricis TaxID=2069301 RepID=A0ABS6JL99_9BACI|nr:hypothetical protein [Evansella tamaricis]MBU9714439.1 hypothetical protein [Evansella tamaricis]
MNTLHDELLEADNKIKTLLEHKAKEMLEIIEHFEERQIKQKQNVDSYRKFIKNL